MKTLYLFLITLLLDAALQAQSHPQKIFSLVHKPQTTASTNNPSPIDSATFQHTLQIYNRLLQARGDSRIPAPKLVMTRAEQHMVWVDFDKTELGLEVKAFEVAGSYGEEKEAALATILAQALIYYFENQATQASTSRDLVPTEDSLAAKARYLGHFLAYNAGFGLFEKSPELMTRLYSAYGLTDKMEGFPDLSDRVKSSRESVEKARKLIELFEMGNYLAVLNKYEDARQYYEYVLQAYQSRELYNNAGVCALLDALGHFRPNEREVKFKFPMELDLNPPISARGGDELVEARIRLLQTAGRHFDEALNLSPGYAPAHLNKACAYAMLGEVQQALEYAETQAGQLALLPGNEKTTRDLSVLLGILQAWNGGTEKAKVIFQNAVAQGSKVAEYNLNKLQVPSSTEMRLSFREMSKEESIDDLVLTDPSNFPEYDPDSEVQVSPEIKYYNNLHPAANSLFYMSYNTASGEITCFLLTKPGYSGKTAQELSVGASIAEIEKAYPDPERVLETPNGQIRIYPSILLILGIDGRLMRWATYGEIRL